MRHTIGTGVYQVPVLIESLMIHQKSCSIKLLFSTCWYILSQLASQYIAVRTHIWASPIGFLLWLMYRNTYTEHYTIIDQWNLPNNTIEQNSFTKAPMTRKFHPFYFRQYEERSRNSQRCCCDIFLTFLFFEHFKIKYKGQRRVFSRAVLDLGTS